MMSKAEQLPVGFVFTLQRLVHIFISQQWKQLESRVSSIIVGLAVAYILLELIPAVNYEYTAFGKQLYWLLLLILSLYPGLKQVLPYHFSYGFLYQRISNQNAHLKKTNQQLCQILQEQEITKQALEKENQTLYRLATIDELTQIQNRRFFEQQIQHEWQQLQREGRPISLILFDVDYFKRYNDHYGHLAGDNCLQKIARAAKKSLQNTTDFVARYGGEEFAVVLLDTDEQETVKIAQTIQQAVQTLAIPHAQSDISPIVSISLGITSLLPTPKDSYKTLINLADQALYKAKRQGRDRYVVSSCNR